MSGARVDFSLSRTLNMGDFESTRIMVGLSLECEPTREDIQKTYAKAKRFVEVAIAKEEHEWKVGE